MKLGISSSLGRYLSSSDYFSYIRSMMLCASHCTPLSKYPRMASLRLSLGLSTS